MQKTPTFPSQNLNSIHLKRLNFQCNASTADKTKLHLSNLSNLLRKTHAESTQSPDQDVPIRKAGSLQGLNLPSRPEEITPPDHSPPNHTAAWWRDYLGHHSWSDLLDPLDENLRREVVRYGEFAKSAYGCFHDDPPVLLNRSYKVTKSLYATSSTGPPTWLDDILSPNLGWMTQRSSCIGYVAVCDDPREIHTTGRRDIVIALRGTITCPEWAENFRDTLVHVDDQAKVGRGFLSLFNTHCEQTCSLSETVTEEVERLMQQYEEEALSISVTGHSLGAALGLLVADSLAEMTGPGGAPIAVFSFGGPRVGNRAFVERVEKRGVKVLRVVNTKDVVTRLPTLFELRRAGLARESAEWSYAHVGAELRVETSNSPHLRGDAGMVCCHDIETYLHLVRLLSEQNQSF